MISYLIIWILILIVMSCYNFVSISRLLIAEYRSERQTDTSERKTNQIFSPPFRLPSPDAAPVSQTFHHTSSSNFGLQYSFGTADNLIGHAEEQVEDLSTTIRGMPTSLQEEDV